MHEQIQSGRTSERYFFGERAFSPEQASRVETILGLCRKGIERGPNIIGYVPIAIENLEGFISTGKLFRGNNITSQVQEEGRFYSTKDLARLIGDSEVEEYYNEKEAIENARNNAQSHARAVHFLKHMLASTGNHYLASYSNYYFLSNEFFNTRRPPIYRPLLRFDHLVNSKIELEELTKKWNFSPDKVYASAKESSKYKGLVLSLVSNPSLQIDRNLFANLNRAYGFPGRFYFMDNPVPANVLGGIESEGKEESEFIQALQKWYSKYKKPQKKSWDNTPPNLP